MIVYMILGLVGTLVMLAGVIENVIWLIPIGGLLVVGSFVWFARTQTSAPVEGARGKR